MFTPKHATSPVDAISTPKTGSAPLMQDNKTVPTLHHVMVGMHIVTHCHDERNVV